MNDKLRRILTVVLVAVFAVSMLMLLRQGADSARSDAANDLAQQIALQAAQTDIPEQPVALSENVPSEPVEAEALPPEPEETRPLVTKWVPQPVEEDDYIRHLQQIDLDALREVNPNVRGWIMIPNTKVNYPIVQGEDNEYYLHHTWDNRSSVNGSIFVEAQNSSDFQDFRTIVYGHNMANGSMFGFLYRYSSQNYWEQYPYIYLVTDEGVLRYEIYSSYEAEVTGKTYALDIDERARASFIQMTLEKSQLNTGIQPAETDRLLTLSTCCNSVTHRRVVHARLVMVQVEVEENENSLRSSFAQ